METFHTCLSFGQIWLFISFYMRTPLFNLQLRGSYSKNASVENGIYLKMFVLNLVNMINVFIGYLQESLLFTTLRYNTIVSRI